MLAWMNEESLRRTLAEGRTVFWSRSRSELWRKGDTSGDRQWLREAYYDCDGDTLLLVVEQEGRGACHTGERTCFHRGELEPLDVNEVVRKSAQLEGGASFWWSRGKLRVELLRGCEVVAERLLDHDPPRDIVKSGFP